MIWLILNDISMQVAGCNEHTKGNTHQLWVERQNGKSMLIYESKDKAEITERREAIDFAVAEGYKTINLA